MSRSRSACDCDRCVAVAADLPSRVARVLSQVHERTSRSPVSCACGVHAVMSSNDDTSTMQRFLTNGAADYLVKPVNKEQLAALRRLIVSPASPSAAAAAAAATAQTVPTAGEREKLRRSSRAVPAAAAAAACDTSPAPADVQQTSCSEDSHRTISQTAVADTGAAVTSILDDGSVCPAELLRACMAKATQSGRKRPRDDTADSQPQAVFSSTDRTSSVSAPSKAATLPQHARTAPAAAPFSGVRSSLSHSIHLACARLVWRTATYTFAANEVQRCM